MDELEAFKRSINLTLYAARQGYEIDQRESSRNSAVMRHADGDKIIVARGETGFWIYFSVRDDADNGTIIDFVQRRKGRCSLGHVRKELRPHTGGLQALPPIHASKYVKHIEPSSKDRQAIIRALGKMHFLTRHAYLEQKRLIKAHICLSERFKRTLRVDVHQNVICPHSDVYGLCGYEIKNDGFTGFAKGGQKGLWFSALNRQDTRLVIAESAIDAMSYHILHPDKRTRYFSTGGSLNHAQPDLIRRAAKRLPLKAVFNIAADNDKAGHKLANQIKNIVLDTGRKDLIIKTSFPQKTGQDWNDVLTHQP